MGGEGPGRRRPQLAAAAALAAVAVATPQAQPRLTSLPEILSASGAYVRTFVREFEVMIADEEYVQTLRRGRARPTRYWPPADVRRMTSEILFMWIPEDRTWLTARNVRVAAGKPVADSEARLAQLLADTPRGSVEQARRLRDEGARFNLGRIRRNISDPTLALQFLDPSLQPRFAFELDGRDRINGAEAWKVRFTERASPTLINTDGRDLPASGEVWVDAADGAVLRTRLEVEDELTRLSGVLQVDYERHERFAIRTPREMTESYEQRVALDTERGMLVQSQDERIDCVARYSNFRCFDTAVRVMTP